MARSPASAEDLVQETYLTALSKPPPDGPMRPWLLGLMRKLAWREIRSGRRRAYREECFHATGPSVAQPDPLLAYGIDRAQLRSIVERLPEPFRSTVEQRFLEGLSCAEIAEAAGVPAGTIRWRQSRALELLRAELEGPPRRRSRRALLCLPLVGLERAAALAPRVLRLPGRARIGFVLAGIALVAVLASMADGDVPAARTARAEQRTSDSPALAATPAPGDLHRIDLAADTGTDAASMSRGARPGADPTAAARRSARARGSRSRSMPGRPQAAPALAARDLYDCDDEGGKLHCTREPAPQPPADAAVCIVLDRSLSALERARAGRTRARSIHGPAFLRAARLANQLLASELGCALATESEREERRRSGSSRDDSTERPPETAGPETEPVCRSEEDDAGRSCTVCVDARGIETSACAPVDCQSSTRTDGSPCTICTDADGQTESDCEVEPEPEPEEREPQAGGCPDVLIGVDVFASEVLPILLGEADLNEGEGPIIGCVRGPCHAVARPEGGLFLDAADTPANNLERFACFVDLARPEDSQVLLCSMNDERCVTGPHPGGEVFSGSDDRNYQRILSFIQASAPQ